MIDGKFGSKGQLFFEIELIASDGLNLPVDILFDSGFTGFMAINEQDLEVLNWPYNGNETMITANGEILFDIYLGKVILDGQEYEIPVHIGDELTEILLGSQWLKILPLVVNYPEGVLTLG